MDKNGRVHILVVGGSDSLGGIEKYIYNYFGIGKPDDFIIHILTMEEDFYFKKNKAFDNCVYHVITKRKKSFLKYIKDIVNVFNLNKELDIVYLNLMTCSCVEIGYLAKLYGLKVVIHCHCIWKGDNKLVMLRHILNRPIINTLSDMRLACSNEAGIWMFKNEEFSVIPNAIDIKKYKYNELTRTQIRKSLGISNKYVIGHVGRLDKVKNHLFLLKIIDELRNVDNNFVLLCIGDGKEKNNIEKYIFEHDLSQNVLLLGKQDNISDYLMAMDIFVFPSLYEGLGIALIEAQASGLKCISSDSVPQETNVTDMVLYKNINSGVSEWTKYIEKEIYQKESDRIKMYEQVKTSKYNLKNEIEKFYSLLRRI